MRRIPTRWTRTVGRWGRVVVWSMSFLLVRRRLSWIALRGGICDWIYCWLGLPLALFQLDIIYTLINLLGCSS